MISEIMKELRESNKLTQQDVADGIKVNLSTYKNYEYGRREPDLETVSKIARFYNVSADYLLGIKPAPDPFGDYQLSEEDEKEVVEKYMSFPPEIRACLMDVLVQLADAARGCKEQQDSDTTPLFVFKRLSVHKASAGVGYDLYDPDAWKEVTVIDCPEAHDADFAVQVEGDSMEDTLHDGDIVYVKIDPNVPVGKIGVFMVDGCGYIKERGTDCLISHNPDYDPIRLDGKEQRCIGLVIGVAELPETRGK